MIDLVCCNRGGVKSRLRASSSVHDASTNNIQPTPHTANMFAIVSLCISSHFLLALFAVV